MLLRRHHIATLLQAMLLTLAFASCVKDDLSSDTAGTDGSESTPYYLNVQLQFTDGDPSATRATRATETNGDDLEYGDHNEHKIGEEGNIIILFKDQKLFGAFALTSLSNHEHNTEDGRPSPGGDGSNEDNNVDDNIEALHAYSTKFPAEEESLFPNSCLVVLNCSKKIQEKLEKYTEKNGLAKNNANASVDDILKIVWDENDVAKEEDPRNIGFSAPDRKYFTMTNSIYFDGENKKVADIEIPKDCIAKTLMAAKPITVRVERMVAKFSFELPKDLNGNYVNIFRPSDAADLIFFNGFNANGINTTAKKWQVEVTGWNVNAYETQNYLFKKIDNNNNDLNDWNNPSNYRAYWSEDPHFDYALNDDGDKTADALQYPWQYRKVIDEANIGYYKEKESATANDNLLRNFSFNDLGLHRPTKDQQIDFNTAFGNKIVYTPENTYDTRAVAGNNGRAHDSRGELLAGTHLLVGAELQIKESDDDNKDDYKTLDHLYRAYDGVYYKSEQECFVALMTAFNQSLISNEVLVYTYYNWDNYATPDTKSFVAKSDGEYRLYLDGKELTDEYLEEIMNMSDEDFAHKIGTLAPATLRRGDGKCLPWLEEAITDGTDSRLKILKKDNNNSLITLDICERKKDEQGFVYAGEKKRNANANDIKSLLYEWVGAVDHFNHGKMYYAHGIYNPTFEKTNSKYYGVIRNSWYKFKLTDINSMGIPVDDPTQPIVPDRVGNEDKINVTINILDWHQVDTIIDNLP